jgi:DNA polymerase
MGFAHNLFIDTEVKAPFKDALDKIGLDVYARHRDTRLLMLSYALDDCAERVLDLYHGEALPADLREAVRDPSVQLVAHNAQYDRTLLRHKAGLVLPYNRWYCTRARAYSHGLPGSLEMLSSIYQLGLEGKKNGDQFIDMFCERGLNPDDYPMEWLEGLEYSLFDITALRKLYKAMPAWCYTETEQRLYHLDQKINDKGFKVDLPLATKIITASEYAQQSLNARIQRLTSRLVDGESVPAIMKGTQRAKVKAWIEAQSEGFELENMRAETLRKAVRDHDAGVIELSPEQLDMIEIRLLSSKSSVSKCKTALNQAGPDARIRYTMTYGGGGRILRWSHKGFQPGNMPRPTKQYKQHIPDIIELLQHDALTTIWGDESAAACSDALRGLIVADDGKKLIAADYSNIEGRKLAWYAVEEWKLQVYRDQDAGLGADGYKLLGQRMTGMEIDEITDFLRQQFKGVDLSMGYEGGVGALLNIANSYQLDLVELAKSALRVLPAEFMERGRSSWAWAQKHGATFGLPEKIYVACAAYRDSYRAACPNIKTLWRTLIDAAKLAVADPGKIFECADGKIKFACASDRSWLAMVLPSGRKIMFSKPKLETVRRFYKDENGDVIEEEEGKVSLTALKSPAWRRQALYGGLIANAATQGGCRDILGVGLVNVDDSFVAMGDGDIILHIHDEIIAELDENSPYTHDSMIADMLRLPSFWAGLPLTAAGFTTKRYRKN